MTTPEQKAQEYSAPIASVCRGQASSAVDAYLAGYRQAIEDAAKLCDHNDPMQYSNALARRIRALAPRSDDGKEGEDGGINASQT